MSSISILHINWTPSPSFSTFIRIFKKLEK